MSRENLNNKGYGETSKNECSLVSKEDIERIFKELKEIRGDINVVYKIKDDLAEITDSLYQKFKELENELKNLKKRLESLENKTQSLDKKIEDTTKFLDKLFDEIIDSLNDKISIIEKRQDYISKFLELLKSESLDDLIPNSTFSDSNILYYNEEEIPAFRK